jgi:hypothetical protein
MNAPLQAAEKLGAALILGGAALQRCDNWPVFNTGFSRRSKTAARKTLFPQPLKPVLTPTQLPQP